MELFAVRPGYQSEELLVEFFGDHRGDGFPNVWDILARGLNAQPRAHPTLDTASIGIATDEHISFWQYENGTYEIDDDIWGLFISAPNNNAQIMADIERALVASGAFEKKIVEFDKYR